MKLHLNNLITSNNNQNTNFKSKIYSEQEILCIRTEGSSESDNPQGKRTVLRRKSDRVDTHGIQYAYDTWCRCDLGLGRISERIHISAVFCEIRYDIFRI